LMVKLCVASGLMPLLAFTTIGNVPLTVAVPLSTPALDSVIPAGSDPLCRENVIEVG